MRDAAPRLAFDTAARLRGEIRRLTLLDLECAVPKNLRSEPAERLRKGG